jgi:hypothetical protein
MEQSSKLQVPEPMFTLQEWIKFHVNPRGNRSGVMRAFIRSYLSQNLYGISNLPVSLLLAEVLLLPL